MKTKRRPASGTEAPAGKGRRSALAGPAALVGAVMAVFAVLFWTLPAPAQTKPVLTDAASISAGETLYDLHCSACHGVGGVGAKGPPLLGVGPAAVDFFLSTGRMPLASPNDEPAPGPPFFSDEQIAQIVAYVNYLDTTHGTPGPGIPDVTPPCGTETADCPTLSEGNSLFLLNCAQCHSASGAGGMLSHGYVVPSVRAATPTQIAEAIRVGPGRCPISAPASSPTSRSRPSPTTSAT